MLENNRRIPPIQRLPIVIILASVFVGFLVVFALGLLEFIELGASLTLFLAGATILTAVLTSIAGTYVVVRTGEAVVFEGRPDENLDSRILRESGLCSPFKYAVKVPLVEQLFVVKYHVPEYITFRDGLPVTLTALARIHVGSSPEDVVRWAELYIHHDDEYRSKRVNSLLKSTTWAAAATMSYRQVLTDGRIEFERRVLEAWEEKGDNLFRLQGFELTEMQSADPEQLEMEDVDRERAAAARAELTNEDKRKQLVAEDEHADLEAEMQVKQRDREHKTEVHRLETERRTWIAAENDRFERETSAHLLAEKAKLEILSSGDRIKDREAELEGIRVKRELALEPALRSLQLDQAETKSALALRKAQAREKLVEVELHIEALQRIADHEERLRKIADQSKLLEVKDKNSGGDLRYQLSKHIVEMIVQQETHRATILGAALRSARLYGTTAELKEVQEGLNTVMLIREGLSEVMAMFDDGSELDALTPTRPPYGEPAETSTVSSEVVSNPPPPNSAQVMVDDGQLPSFKGVGDDSDF